MSALVLRNRGVGGPKSQVRTEALTTCPGQREVHWVGPAYQKARADTTGAPEDLLSETLGDHAAPKAKSLKTKLAWPESVAEQIAIIRSTVAGEPMTPDVLVKRFKGARKDLVAQQFEVLALMGELSRTATGQYSAPMR